MGEGSHRLNGVAHQRVQHVVAGRHDVSVQEQEIGRCGINLRSERLVPLRPHVDIVEHRETAAGSAVVEGSGALPRADIRGAELGVAGVGVVLDIEAAQAVFEVLARLEAVYGYAVQAAEDAPSGEGVVQLCAVFKLHVCLPRHLAGPEDGELCF